MRIGEKNLGGNLQGKSSFGRNGRKWEGNITILKWILKK